MKKILSVVIFVFVISFSFMAFAEDVTVTLDGEALSFDVEPVIIDGRVMVPMRTIFEALGFSVDWDAEISTVKALRDDRAIVITIDENYLFVITDKLNVTELDVPARLIDSRTLVPVRAVSEGACCEVNWNNDSRMVEISTVKEETAAKENKVTVKNADELLAAIDSNTEIDLEPGEYNLTKTAAKNKNITINEVFDGFEYIISDVENLTIKGSEGVTVVVEPRYANVFNFVGCSGITLENLTVGHTVEQGYCMGGVINIEKSENVLIDGCKMYGCGTYGITAENVDELNVINSEIYECSYGIMVLKGVHNSSFKDSVFRDCGGFGMITMYSCGNVDFNGCIVKNNRSVENIVNVVNCSDVAFRNSIFENNTFKEKDVLDDVIIENCSGIYAE